MRLKITVLCLFLLAAMPILKAQYTTLGSGVFNGTTAGPWRASTTDSAYYSRFAYIYPSAVISNIKHGDTVQTFEVSRAAGAAPNFNTILNVYAINTTAATFGTNNVPWDSLSAKCKLVFSGSPANYIGANTQFYALPVNNGPWVYDTTKGKNIVLLFDYAQTKVQAGLIGFDFDATNIAAYALNTTKFVYGPSSNNILNGSTTFHPMLRLNYPRKEFEMALLNLYSLGKMPVPLGNPDSVRLLVRNTGKKALNHSVYLRISGANSKLDSNTITLAPSKEQFVTLKAIVVNNQGLDSILVYSKIGMPIFDSVYSFRNNTENLYSYENPKAPGNSGGIGFNGVTGDFVARFFSNTQKYINQISVNFGLGGRPFRIGIWSQGNGGRPGALLWHSDSFISQAGKYILDLTNPVIVNGNFFVGVRQLGTSNVAFGYQPELPVRPNTFLYASPLNDTNWIDFAPDAPFRFLIEPRIQADTDLIVSSIINPLDTFLVNGKDSIQPSCRVKNIGVFGVKVKPFSVQCIIRQFGSTLYNETLFDTLSAGKQRTYVFNKKIKPLGFGEHQAYFIVKYGGDKVKDNDTLIKRFFVGIKNEVGIIDVYEPIENYLYKYKLDTFIPIIAVKNIGFNKTAVFPISYKVMRGNNTLASETINVSLTGGEDKFIIFKTYRCLDTGRLKVIYSALLPGDSFIANNRDTVNILVYKQRDLKADSVIEVGNAKSYSLNTAVIPRVRIKNEGLLDEINAKLFSEFTSVYTPKVYKDTVTFGALYGQSSNVNMKPYKGLKKGLYLAKYTVKHSNDFYPENDTIRTTFSIGNANDYAINTIVSPSNNAIFSLNPDSVLKPKAILKNNGYIKSSALCAAHCIIKKNNVLVYSDVKSVALDTGLSFEIPFASTFKFANPGKYTLYCISQYVNDEIKSNDTQIVQFTVEIDRDLALDSLLVSDSMYLFNTPETMRVVASNNGKFAMLNQLLVMEIDSKIYDSLRIDLAPFESKKVSFSKTFAPSSLGNYKLRVFPLFKPDVIALNDTISITTRAYKKYDLSLAISSSFCAGSFNANGTKILIPLQVQNIGSKTSPIANAILRITNSQNSTEIFRDTVSIGALNSSASNSINSNKLWHLNTKSAYIVQANLMAFDSFLNNDSALCFIVVAENGVQTIMASNQIKVIPNPATSEIELVGLTAINSGAIYTSLGQKVLDFTGANVNIHSLPAGTYFVQVQLYNRVATVKLIKQ